jgi:hypothetical protein
LGAPIKRARQFHALLRGEGQGVRLDVGDSVQIEQLEQGCQPGRGLSLFAPHAGQAQRVGDETGMIGVMRAHQHVVAYA